MTDRQRSIKQILFDRSVGAFFIGKIFSVTGMWVQNVAAAILVFELTGSALWVGVISTAQFVGPLALGLWAGALSDRMDRRLLVMGARGVAGTLMVVLSVLSFAGLLTPERGPMILVGVMVLLGLTMAVSLPAMQSIVPVLVPPRDLEPALALSAVGPSIARMAGPALAAGLIVAGGPGLAFAVAATAHLAFAASLVRIRTRQAPAPKKRPDLLGGVKYVMAHRHIRFLLLGAAIMGVGADTVITLTPPAAEALGGSAELVGLLASSFGTGAVVGLLVMRPLRRFMTLRRLAMSGYLVGSAGLVVAGFAATASTLSVGMGMAGIGFMITQITLNTRVQQDLPDLLRGRVMALWGMAFAGSRPIAAMLNGAIADFWSVDAAFFVAAAILVVGTPLVSVRVSDDTKTRAERVAAFRQRHRRFLPRDTK